MPLAELEYELRDVSVNGQVIVHARISDPTDSTRAIASDVTISDPDSTDDYLGRVEMTFGSETAGVMRGKFEKRLIEAGGFERAVVFIDTQEHRVTDEVLDALAHDDELYCRGPALARVVSNHQPNDGIQRADGAPTITMAAQAWLRERITRHVQLKRMAMRDKKMVEADAHPPQWLVQAAAARGEWPMLRQLTAISDSPVLRPDGTVHQTAGYDRTTGVLFMPVATFPPLPKQPTHDQALAAVKRLEAVVNDFIFENPAHKSAWLASLLSPLARHAFNGPCPGFLTDANTRGAGKGLLNQVTGEIATGRAIPVCGYSHDPIEMGKRITSIVIAGDPIILLDNLTGTFGNEALDRALTGTRWKDRLLGRNETIDLPLLAVLYATGNNVSVGADTARRLLHIRLEVMEENPEERSGFTHPDLLAWVRTSRTSLLIDAMTILSAYCCAGRPDQNLTPFGSFEGWSGLVRSALVWCGVADPCNTRARLAEMADLAADNLTQLVNAWKTYDAGGTGIIVAEMVAKLYPKDYQPVGPDSVAMRAALETLTNCPAGKAPSVRQVASRLKSYRRRVIKGMYLDIDTTRASNAGAIWKLMQTEKVSQ